MKTPRHFAALFVAVASGTLLAGCTNNDSLAQQYSSGENKGYISSSGVITEFKPDASDKPVHFATTLLDGKKVTQDTYQGKVLVVNSWYAGCPPCRAEAKDLEKVSTETADEADFLGVNVHDQTATAAAFVRTFDLTYGNTSDVRDANMQLAFSGSRGPNSTPSTIVVNAKGQVTARILGMADPSILKTLIDTAAK